MKRGLTAHRLYGAVEIDGNIYRVKITLKENFSSKEAKVPHSYEAQKIELLAGTLAQPEYGSNPNTNNSISLAKLLKNVEKSYDKGKNFWKKARGILNYTLLIMAEEQSFDEFDHSHMGKVLRRQWLGDKHTSISLHRDGKSES